MWKVERWNWDEIKKIGWWIQILVVEEKEAEKLILKFREQYVCARARSEIGEMGCTKNSSWKLRYI